MVSAKKTGKDFEKRVAERLECWGADCRVVPFSGAGKYEKGDIQSRICGIDFLIECKKTRGKESWTLERTMLEKIEMQAKNENREPLLVFGFNHSKLYCTLPLEQLLKLLYR